MNELISEDGVPNRLEMARIEEKRQAVATAEVAREAESIAGGTMAFGGEGSWANQAAGIGLNGPVTSEELDALVEFYVSRGHEPRIEVASVADPSLHEGLAARGFVLKEWEHVLVRVLLPDEDFAHPWAASSDELLIERLDPSDDDATREWVELSMGGFYPPDEKVPASDMELGLQTARHPRTIGFVARMNGIGAGAAGLEVSGNASALFATSVKKAFRRRGIQLALIVRRLQHARDAGARIACIHSRPNIATERNAMRLGFFLAYPKAVLVQRGNGLKASQ